MFGPFGLFSGNQSTSQEKTEEVKDPKQAIKDDAAKDAEAIKTAFETKGVQEAWGTLKKERLSAKSLSAEDQDVWEKTVSQHISKSTNKLLLPGLTIAYMNENKDALTNSNGYIKKAEINHKKDMINLTLQMEKGGCASGADDVEGLLLNGAADSIAKGIFNPINAINEMQRGLFSHKQNEEEAVKASRLDDAMEMMSAMAKKEAGFVKNRDFNKSIADRMAGDDKLFSLIDEHNKDNKVDGKITLNEVDRFLKHVDGNEYYKKNFTDAQISTARDLQKSLKDTNTYEDPNGTLLTHKGVDGKTILAMSKSGWIPEDKLPAVTKETLQKSVSPPQPKVESTPAEAKVTEDTNEDKSDDTTNVDDVTTDKNKKVEEKAVTKDPVQDANKDDEKAVDLHSGDYENQLVNDGTQKAGEGPWQVASRLLKGKNDPAAQKALTEILKQQLIDDTKSKDYKEAVTKLEVGHTFLTCEGLNHLREKAKESGNETLIKLFGEPKMQAAANAVTYHRGGWA